MHITATEIPDIRVVEPKVFADSRGFFFESFNHAAFRAATGFDAIFVQDNHSRSARGVLRGLHYQVSRPQGKLVRVTHGEVFDVAVDVRSDSPTFGKWVGVVLSAQNKLQLWIPKGFAHGFYVTSDYAEVQYKTTDYYAPEGERTIVWNDPDLAIRWPLSGDPVLSDKDRQAGPFRDADVF